MISLIAFLGNVGREYEKTRHNAAWIFENSLPFAAKINWKNKFKGQFSAVDTITVKSWCEEAGLNNGKPINIPDSAGNKIYFLMPETYMNLSGDAIGEAARFLKIKPEEILVVHDELELPIGTVSLKFGGGLGGHNGLRSTKANLGTADFWRLRFGISKPTNGNIADYVLSSFTSDEQIILSQIFPQVHELLEKVLFSAKPENLIAQWGKRKLVPEVK
ncbi:MAG: aminoacyl-tRNA hydrolase [Treponema sp.]|nr:aminoacyl-tRNA hydrolase [Treponema sp.]